MRVLWSSRPWIQPMWLQKRGHEEPQNLEHPPTKREATTKESILHPLPQLREEISSLSNNTVELFQLCPTRIRKRCTTTATSPTPTTRPSQRRSHSPSLCSQTSIGQRASPTQGTVGTAATATSRCGGGSREANWNTSSTNTIWKVRTKRKCMPYTCLTTPKELG